FSHDQLTLLPLFLHPFFLFHPTPRPSLYTLSLHDALPIFRHAPSPRPGLRRYRDRHLHPPHDLRRGRPPPLDHLQRDPRLRPRRDRKSTRLNSSHVATSYAVFCLKKKTYNWSM